jgi:hypothetical protein
LKCRRGQAKHQGSSPALGVDANADQPTANVESHFIAEGAAVKPTQSHCSTKPFQGITTSSCLAPKPQPCLEKIKWQPKLIGLLAVVATPFPGCFDAFTVNRNRMSSPWRDGTNLRERLWRRSDGEHAVVGCGMSPA